MTMHYFFDMDGTICESRMVISDEIREALNKLPNVYVISGASREQMEKQLVGLKCKILAQNGNDTEKWANYLSDEQKARIRQHIKLIRFKTRYKGELEDRQMQMSFSFTGHNADLKLKKKFDPKKTIRNQILKTTPFIDPELKAVIAGTTCIDYISKNKGENLKQYVKPLKKCVYFGDNLQTGGNDHSVIGIMETVPVTLKTVLKKLKKYA